MLSTGLVLAACAADPVPSEEVAVARAALSESISPFPAAGDFEESSDLNNWTGTCARSSSLAHTGSYSLRCGGGQSHTMTLDATGYTGIAITYWRYGSSLESGETFTLEWSTDGSNWTVLETVSDASWVSKSHSLPSGADNASALRLRFSTSANSSSYDAAYLDNLDITGTSGGGAVCGNAVCDSGEDCSSCSADCGECLPVCGDAVCDSGEDCNSCSADCGECPEVCGDAVCDSGEDCSSCSADCGSCGGTPTSISPFAAAGDFEESSDLNNWMGTCARSSSQAHTGSYSLRCGGGQSHTMTLDATGYTGIAITYWRYGSSLESGETFTLEWSTDGSNWTVLETVSDASWVSKSHSLPSGADNASALRLRFSTSASSSSSDAAYLDDLDITGVSGAGAVCGNAVCESGEDCSSCSADCGSCPVCGDAVCDAGEDCTNCSGDCGSCVGTDDPQVPGPYGACYYETDMRRAQYEGERMYYPCAPGSEPSGPISGGVYGASTLSPGYTNSASVIFWLAEHAASHGFVVLAMEPTNNWGYNPDWRDAHIAAYHELIEENGRSGSPVQSSIDTSKIQIMGFSKGGGGTLMAAQQLTSEGKVLGAVQPLAPYYDTWSDVNLITAPVAIHVGADDTTAKPSSHAIPMFNGLSANTTRLLAIYTGFGHGEWYSGSGTHRHKIKQYVTSWMKLHLDGNTAYYTYIDGADHQPGWFTQYDLIEP